MSLRAAAKDFSGNFQKFTLHSPVLAEDKPTGAIGEGLLSVCLYGQNLLGNATILHPNPFKGHLKFSN